MTLTVALVDSNPADRSMLRRMLNSSDLEVYLIEFGTAHEFKDVSFSEIDCALIDCHLPDMDGIDALVEVCQGRSHPPCPVVVMSGQGDEYTAARAFKAGANDYLIKESIAPNGLWRTVVNAIDKWHAEEAIRHHWETQRHALRDAERASNAKTHFISSLSHQLRVPLTAILGFSEMIETSDLGDDREAWDKYKVYAGDINRSAREVLELMSGIIDLACAEDSDMMISVKVFDPRRALRDVIDGFSDQVRKSAVNLRVDDGYAPQSMVSDDRAVTTIMSNLLSNAIKFTPAGQHVQVQLREMDDNKCLFSVADTGVGMDPESLKYLMRPFERHRGQDLTASNDLGIGLPLVNSLVRSLGGDLKFDTAPGMGTTATVVLPRLAQSDFK